MYYNTMIPGCHLGRGHLPTPTIIVDREKKIHRSFCVSLFGVSVPIVLPALHLLLVNQLWGKYTRQVNQSTCNCGCWDSAFKANYEVGLPRYKHVYFNATYNTLKIWICTSVAIIALYECVCRAIKLHQKHSLRYPMLVLFSASIYSHYYTWWSFFNYWNDEYFFQWWHQVLFSASEVTATVFVFQLLDKSHQVIPWKVVVVVAVAIAHCLSAISDQFGHNVLQGEGELHQVLRDLGFMFSDLLHIWIPVRQLKIHAKQCHLPPSFLLSNQLFAGAVCIVLVLWGTSVFML